MKKEKVQKDPSSFQEAFEQLERLVSEFETGNVHLEEALNKFEQGLVLASFCKKRLAEIENRVIDIKKKFNDLHVEEDT